MCLIAFAWMAHRDYPLVVAGNRDEFFARPTAAADWWADRPLLAGRDLRAGGTWMGVTRTGRFAALTNHRDPASTRSDAPSRGSLVGDFLDRDEPARSALERVARDPRRFNGYNLLAADLGPDREHGLWIVSGPDDARVAPVAPGIHALSNARLDTPWPKVGRATAGVRDALSNSMTNALTNATGIASLVERLFATLADRSIAEDAQLPATGVSLETERALSAAFIRMPGYGTRASTVFIVDRDGHATFVERAFEPDRDVAERRFAFDVSATRAT